MMIRFYKGKISPLFFSLLNTNICSTSVTRCRESFPTLTSSWILCEHPLGVLQFNSVQFCYYLLGVSIRSHRLTAQSHRTASFKIVISDRFCQCNCSLGWEIGYWCFLCLPFSRVLSIVVIFLFFIYLLILERKGEREKHWFVVPLINAFIDCLYVPWRGIKPSSLVYWDDALTIRITWPGQQ